MTDLITLDLDAPHNWPQSVLKTAASEYGRRSANKRITNAGGKPAMLRCCPYCAAEIAGRDHLAAHKRSCRAKT